MRNKYYCNDRLLDNTYFWYIKNLSLNGKGNPSMKKKKIIRNIADVLTEIMSPWQLSCMEKHLKKKKSKIIKRLSNEIRSASK